MLYSNIDFAVRYVDPSIVTGGDGLTPATALKDLPATADAFVTNTCYIIRRTAETYAVTVPNGTNSAIANLLLMGMPNVGDLLYALVPAEAKTAWGADSAPYANMKSAAVNGSFQLPNICHFLLHRVYLFRDGINADNYIFKFTNSTDYRLCASFEHCKFGGKGVNLDVSSYTGAVTASRCKSYVSVYYARMLNIADCTVNYALAGNTSNAHGITCRFAEVLNVEDVRVYSAVSYTSSSYYPLMLSENAEDGIECSIRNVKQTVRFNGTYEYVPLLMSCGGYLNMAVSNITVAMGNALSTARPANFYLQGAVMQFSGVKDISVTDVSADLPNCWNCTGNVLRLSRCYSGNYVPGCVKEVRNVSVTLASADGIGVGSPISYANAAVTGDDHAALYLQFSSEDTKLYAKSPQLDTIMVKNPRGRSLFLEGGRLTNATLEGSATIRASIADIDSLGTWFPGYVLNADYGSHVRVHALTVNLANPVYPYNEDPAIGTDFNSNGNVFVDASNASLRPMACQSGTGNYIYQGVGCNNEGTDGHFAFRCPNGLCDTWSVHRTGGGAAALKLYNNACNTARTMVLGRKPFKGMQLLPSTTGRHLLRMHAAWKGYADDAEMYRKLFISATAGNKTLYSSLAGRWADDAGATWVNDTDLTQKVLEMPLDLPDVSPVDVRIYFCWYSASGFVYIDPAIELIRQ